MMKYTMLSSEKYSNCIVCGVPARLLLSDVASGRDYLVCDTCDLRFLRPEHRLSAEDERAHYSNHKNDPGDPRYQSFVAPVREEILKRVPVGCSGLDFGCGPNSVVVKVLSAAGYLTDAYDPFFSPNESALDRTYDFVVATEVAEHLFAPLAEFETLYRLLKPGGPLVLMTLLASGEVDFDKWYYRIDPTHVAFYSEKTMKWIQDKVGFSRLEIMSPRVVVLTK